MSDANINTVAIIMDGNRRWAKERGLNPWDGHRKGAEILKELLRWTKERGDVRNLFFYVFSTENWKRDSKEVEYLFNLVEEFFSSYLEEALKENVRVRVAGQLTRFSEKLQRIFSEVEEKTAGNTALTVWLGLSYGGRSEIIEAVNTAIQKGEPVTEESFKKMLWTADMPDPDIVLRVGGERRLSNFLTWGSVYSELFFSDTLWPAFTKEEYFGVLDAYAERERRMGK